MGCRQLLLALAFLLISISYSSHSLETNALKDIILTKCKTTSLHRARLDYTIFRGLSSLRGLPSEEQRWIESYGKSASALMLFLSNVNYADAAHEVILGVTPENIADAEYAATHPGSGWTDNHPLSTTDDWIHAIIHRDRESHYRGEGNHTGWENAMYWVAGGPKQLPSSGIPRICTHPMAKILSKKALLVAPNCCKKGLIPNSKMAIHKVLADGGGRRTVCIPPGHFDAFRFIALLQSAPPELEEELEELRLLEYKLLLDFCLSNGHDETIPGHSA
jgi:hypothetical protein